MTLTQEQQKALLEDRSENSTIGFKDPDGKYPLRNLMNEPDTNRLARGIIKDTAIAFKDQTPQENQQNCEAQVECRHTQ